MPVHRRRRFREGVQPYDRLHGARVGALVGGVIGIVPAAVFWPAFGWVLVGAVCGATAGYLYRRHGERSHP